MISTRQLVYRYAGGPALAFADLDLPPDGVLLLGGASGSGKSTWLALVAGLIAPTAGQLEVAGQALAGVRCASGGLTWRCCACSARRRARWPVCWCARRCGWRC